MEKPNKQFEGQKGKTPEQIEVERQAQIMKEQNALFKKMEASAKKAQERGQDSWQNRADLNG